MRIMFFAGLFSVTTSGHLFLLTPISWQLRDTFLLFRDNFGTPLPLNVTISGHLASISCLNRDTFPLFRDNFGTPFPAFLLVLWQLRDTFVHPKNHFSTQIHPEYSSFYKKPPIFATQSKPTHHKWFSLLARLTRGAKRKFRPFFRSRARFLFVTL